MAIYLINLLLIPFWWMVTKKIKNGNKYFYGIILLQFLIISGFRDMSVGFDQFNYELIFYNYSGLSLKSIFIGEIFDEFGYKVMNKILYSLFHDYRSVMILGSLLINYCILKYIRDFSVNPALSLWIYVATGWYQISFSNTRQFIAIGLILISYKFAKEKKLILFLMMILLAFSFHFSAIAALIIYPIINRNEIGFNKKTIVLIGIFILLRRTIFEILIGFIPQKYLIESNIIKGEGSILLILWIVLFIALMVIRSKKNERKINYIGVFLFIAIIIQSIVPYFFALNRLAYYFIIPVYLLIPNIFYYSISKKDKIITNFSIALLAIAYYFLVFYPSGASNTIPYRFMSF